MISAQKIRGITQDFPVLQKLFGETWNNCRDVRVALVSPELLLLSPWQIRSQVYLVDDGGIVARVPNDEILLHYITKQGHDLNAVLSVTRFNNGTWRGVYYKKNKSINISKLNTELKETIVN